MKTAQHTKQYIVSIVIIAFAMLIVPVSVYAQAPPLEVVFTPDPLFDVENFLPGDEVSGEVIVTNNSGQSQNVIVEAINVSDNDGLGDKLWIMITENPILYNDNFGVFLRSGEVPLSALSSGNSKTYTFTISFINDSDNAYKGKSLGFDLCIGFEGGNSKCGDTIVGNEEVFGDGNGGGGGGGGTIPGSGGGGGGPLIITDGPNVEMLSGTSVKITWTTNYFSTSQVVYSSSTEPHTLDLNALFYGYAHAEPNPASNNKITDHSITLTGLLAGTEYFYRVASSASPPTISKEHSLTTSGVYIPSAPSDGNLALGNVGEDTPTAEPNNGYVQGPVSAGTGSGGGGSGAGFSSSASSGSGSQSEGGSETENTGLGGPGFIQPNGGQTGGQIITGGSDEIEDEKGGGLAAATFLGLSAGLWLPILLLLLLLLIIAWFIWNLYRRDRRFRD